MDYTKKNTRLRAILKETLSEKRYSHSLRTAESAIELAKYHPILKTQLTRVEFTALAHDIAREFNTVKLIKLVKKSGLHLTLFEKRNPLTIHGKAAVELLRTDWEIADTSILQAVQFHTIGDPDMDDLAKIIYIADFIEPGRKYHKDWPWLSVQSGTLNDILLGVLTESQIYLSKSGKKMHPKTKKLIKKLKRLNKLKNTKKENYRG